MLQYPAAAASLEIADSEGVALLPLPGIDLLQALLAQVQGQPLMTTAQLLEHWRGHSSAPALARLAMADQVFAGDRIEQELKDTFAVLIDDYFATRIEGLQQKSSQGGLTTAEKQELMLLLSESKASRN